MGAKLWTGEPTRMNENAAFAKSGARNIPTGYFQVTDGLSVESDLMFSKSSKRWEAVDLDHAGKAVINFFGAVCRRDGNPPAVFD